MARRPVFRRGWEEVPEPTPTADVPPRQWECSITMRPATKTEPPVLCGRVAVKATVSNERWCHLCVEHAKASSWYGWSSEDLEKEADRIYGG